MKRIVYTRPDGGISIVAPSPNKLAALLDDGLSEAEALAAIQKNVVPADATNILTSEAADIPADRTFRDAWERDTAPGRAPVKVNMAKARVIHRDRLRGARPPRFTELDAKWMKAVATNDSTEATRCEAQRQTLRDLPQNPAIDAAATPEDLMALWPAELPAP